MKIQHLFNDSEGESHFGEIEVEFAPVEFAPPAPPIDLSEFRDAKRVAIMRAEPGWKGEWHPAPCRQLMFYLARNVDCYMCYACLNFCPKEAIQIYSKIWMKSYTTERGRYPYTTIEDIVGQKEFKKADRQK